MTPNPEILEIHRQQHLSSCIAMAVEYVLKELKIIPINSFEYQSDRTKDRVSEWVTEIQTEKIIFNTHDNLPSQEIISKIGDELIHNRIPIVILQVAPDVWHTYVVCRKREEDGNYDVVTSTPGMGKSRIEVKDLECRIPTMTGVGLITYQSV